MSTKETALEIKTFGAPVLRQKAKPVIQVTEEHRDILSKMAGAMYESAGIGLAASQVGFNEAMIVADIGSGLYKFINPQIIKRQGSQENQEGCLSVPGVCIKIKRSRNVIVKAQDEYAKPVTVSAEGLLACVLQHEIDHLKGKLIVDYASFIDKIKIGKKLKELKKQSQDEKLPQPKTKSYRLQL